MAQKENLKLLEALNDSVRQRFDAQKKILSYEDFFDLFAQTPVRFSRSAYQYLTDMIEYYGVDETPGPMGRSFKVFEQAFNGGKGAVWGHGDVQSEIYHVLKTFARGGRADKLILLHGPNGSAKTSLVACLLKGLENYSQQEEGALYRFNWIFPEERITKESIGFSKSDQNGIDPAASYAYLPEDRIAAKVACQLRDNPIFLLPRGERAKIFAELKKSNPEFDNHDLSIFMQDGDLSPKNRQIYDSLLAAYGGDYARVLRHVQVERYFLSERYKVGAVTIEPQMSVDAHIQQVTADRSLSSLPPVLQNLNIFDTSGHLIQANHGILEYSDLLKRPLDAYKYLLGTCEKGTINLDVALVYLDLVMIGSSNDKYLEGFKQVPDFTSFKGRMELIRTPYLRNFLDEQKIYDEQVSMGPKDRKVTPHLTEIVALWCVLTRLLRPNPEKYSEDIRPIIKRINPLEKAIFYASGEVPDWISMAEAKELLAQRGRLLHEFDAGPIYEGSMGASPREGKMLMQSVAQGDDHSCISPRMLFAHIRKLIQDVSVFEWLQAVPDGEYGDQKALLDYVQQYYIRKVDNELKVAMEMVEEAEYAKALERYVAQTSAWLQKTKVLDPISGVEKPVDERFIRETELIIAPEDDPRTFRQDVVSRVAAYALDHPNQPVAYDKIFSRQIQRIENHYFSQQQSRIAKLHENLMRYMTDRKNELADEDRQEVERLLDRMQTRFGYHPDCTREVVGMLMSTKYKKNGG